MWKPKILLVTPPLIKFIPYRMTLWNPIPNIVVAHGQNHTLSSPREHQFLLKLWAWASSLMVLSLISYLTINL